MGKEVAPNNLNKRIGLLTRGLLVAGAVLGASTADIKYPDNNPPQSALTVSISEHPNFYGGQIHVEGTIPIGDNPDNNPPQSAPINENINFWGGRIDVERGLPKSYVLFDGTSGVFNPQEVADLRRLAMYLGEPQIITTLPFKGMYPLPNTFSPKHPEQHPQLLTLPKDVLSDKQLKEEKGIDIIQSNHTRLYIRPKAFEKDGPLARFDDGSRKKMTIVFVDGPAVSTEFMQDTKYDTVRHLIPEDAIKSNPEEYKMGQIKLTQEKISSLLQTIEFQRRLIVPDQKAIESLFKDLLLVKIRLFFLENALSPQLKNEEFISSHKPLKTGAYDRGPELTITNPNSDLPIKLHPHVKIFLAVGTVPETPNLVVYFDNNGSLKILAEHPYGNWKNFGLRPDQGYPDPSDFEINPAASKEDPNSYLYGGGYTLRLNFEHELAHDFFIAQKHEDDQDANESEYDADKRAIERTRKAWEKLQQQGDNSGFPFIFKVIGGFIAAHLPQRTPNIT